MDLDSNKPIPAIVQQAEMTETQLVETAKSSLSNCNWTIGRCASEWKERYANKRSDEVFGALIGLSKSQVSQRKLVWVRFGGKGDTYLFLKWSHFYAALRWDDADKCLQWANEHEATVSEMGLWRQAQHEKAAPDPPPTLDPTPESTEIRFPSEWVDAFPNLDDDHFIAAVGWKDREDALLAATTNEWSVEDMLRWHNAVSEPADEPSESTQSGDSTTSTTASSKPVANKIILSLRKIKKQFDELGPDDLPDIGEEIHSVVKKFDSMSVAVGPPPEKKPKKKAQGSTAFKRPTLDEVAEYCKIRGNSVNPEAWMDHYLSNGWKVGRNPMKDWKAAVRKWEQSGFNNGGPSSSGGVGNGKPGGGRNSAGLDRVFDEIKNTIKPEIEEEDVPF